LSHPDLVLGWNLGPSDDGPPRPSDLTRSFRDVQPGARPWDTTLGGVAARPGEDDLTGGFRLDPGGSEGPPVADPTGVTRPGQDVGPGAAIPFPRIGEGIGDFRLVAELGRGAFGRVYLAEEAGLGDRPVALKVTRPEGDEPRLLARLQHTHIVPIHSVHDDPATGLRLMCMPYFGGADLARVLEAAGANLPTEAVGRSLISALEIVGKPVVEPDGPGSLRRQAGPGRPSARDQSRAGPGHGESGHLRSILGRIPWWSRSIAAPVVPPEEPDITQPARRFLREAGFVRASAWIAARLAEGLEHAHSRGLLHRDLKPSNILIAADGTPMLLDFNLAADSVGPAEGDRAMLGGTLPYMAPEHLDAFNPQGTTPPEAVDQRSDLYALGLILFEMVAGHHPFPEPPGDRPLLEVIGAMTQQRRGPAPSPRAINREVPAGLDAIIRKCLDPDPARRHARAGDLAEDLRRFLDDRPLKHTAEPSLAEVAAKWARRNPRLTSGSAVALLSLGLIAAVVGGAWTATEHLRQVSARLKLRVFESRFQECQFLLQTTGGPAEGAGRGLDLAEAAIRQAGLDGPEGRTGRGSRSWLATLPPAKRDKVLSDLSELIQLAARARVLQAERARAEPRRRAALEAAVDRLDLAERIDPSPPQALFAERARYHAALGQATQAARDRDRARATAPTSGRDFYLLGTAHLAGGRPDRAEPDLLRATALDDRPFWAWFALGLCHYDQGRFAESAGDFAVCTVVAPKFAWPWMNRGLALARAGRLVEAMEAYHRALAIDGQFAEALVNRGLTRLELGQAPAAVADLEKALALGRRDPSIRAALAEALARSGRRGEGLRHLDALIESRPEDPLARVVRGTILLSSDPKGAEADFRQVLAVQPRHAGAHLGLARLFQADPPAALPHADLAVEGDPGRLEAVELRALLRARLGDRHAVGDVDRLIQAPTPHRLYNAACALALLHQAHPDPALAARALDLLRRALESGFPREPHRTDPDLKSLRLDPAFQAILGPA
jgi:serine/threonine protein kinase/Tfp pilus assembly protein PilF